MTVCKVSAVINNQLEQYLNNRSWITELITFSCVYAAWSNLNANCAQVMTMANVGVVHDTCPLRTTGNSHEYLANNTNTWQPLTVSTSMKQ